MSTYAKLTDREKLELLFKYITQVNSAKDLESTLLILANMGRDIVSAERCTLWLLDQTGENLYSKVAHGVDFLTINAKTGIVGECVQSGETLLINDPYHDGRFNPQVDKQTGFATKSILCEPLVNTRGDVIGAIQILNKVTEDGKFSEEDIQTLIVAASFAGNTLETFLVNQEILEAQKETILLLGELCEKRSLETGKHTARVAAYSVAIAQQMGMTYEEIQLLRQASALHDIGKLATPDRILLKPGKLTAEEFDEMKKHAEIGYNMLKNSNNRILQSGALISYQHHEKYNGKGYPQGLKGDEIHSFSRISALADVFDAISSTRCYKAAWELQECLELVRKESGEHFDPVVVEAFFAVEDKILGIYKDLKD